MMKTSGQEIPQMSACRWTSGGLSRRKWSGGICGTNEECGTAEVHCATWGALLLEDSQKKSRADSGSYRSLTQPRWGSAMASSSFVLLPFPDACHHRSHKTKQCLELLHGNIVGKSTAVSSTLSWFDSTCAL